VPEALGRSPLGAKTQRRTGFSHNHIKSFFSVILSISLDLCQNCKNYLSTYTNVGVKNPLLYFYQYTNLEMQSVMGKQNKENDIKEVAGFAAGGAAAGMGVAAFVGNMGLAGAFGAVAVGAAPVVAAGAVLGVAAFGLKKVIE
jgi:hypothetical protein